MEDLQWLVGTAVAVVGTVLAGLEYLHARRTSPVGGARRSRVDEHALDAFQLFVPHATVQGQAESFLNRTTELGVLRDAMRGGTSVVSIEGLAGCGKTALAATLCTRLPRRYRVGWVPCADRTVTLRSLAAGLSHNPELPRSGQLAALLAGSGDDGPALTHAIIRYLADNRVVLVLDSFHAVDDDGVRALVETAQRSRIRSTVVLTSRRREVVEGPLVERLTVDGLGRSDAQRFLRSRHVDVPDDQLDELWVGTGRGIPQALLVIAGLSLDRKIAEVLASLPVYREDLDEWIGLIIADLTPNQRSLAQLVAFVYEPASKELLRAVAPRRTHLEAELAALRRRYVISEANGRVVMHDLLRDHLRTHVPPSARRVAESRIAGFYRTRARELLLPRGGSEEPSYGLLYIESFPDYVDDHRAHQGLVDDLMARLRDRSLAPSPDSVVLVLGSGHGTHDAGLARHRLAVVNVDLQVEIAVLGKRRAADISGPVHYVAADMVSSQLPFAPGSFDAVFNIGSSFGYEESDADNAAVFGHAARALKPGRPFVFEYVNGRYWQEQRVEQRLETTHLANGAVRKEYRVIDPASRTSSSYITLERRDGSRGWLHHFMHYYTLDEIAGMMTAVGLDPVAVHDGTGGRVPGLEFDPRTSSSMVVVATKRS